MYYFCTINKKYNPGPES